jgi:hypothetical protein
MSGPVSARTRLLALVAATLLTLSACSSGDNTDTATQDGNSSNEQALAQTDSPTAVTPASSTTNFVATSDITGIQPVYESPDGELKVELDSPTSIGAPLVFLLKEDLGDWLEVYLPIRPNGSTGYVRTQDVTVSSHEWSIKVELSSFLLTVYEADEVFMEIDIAVAADNSPTPGGFYYTTELIQPTNDGGVIDSETVYGTYAYGLSGFSEVHESFNGGPGQLGIHGTNQPELIGQKVSAGCIRMNNDDIDLLAPVLPLGVPVAVIV